VHPDQLTVPAATVRALVDAQFPAWRDLPVTRVAAQGTVNAIFRLGGRLAARFPLVPRDVAEARAWLAAEAEAARELAGRTRFRTPEPVALGEPGAGYPLPWSVQTWLTGTVATDADPAESVGFAHDLAEFIRGVRAIDTRGRVFAGTGRGGDLRRHDAWLETCFRAQRGPAGRAAAAPGVGAPARATAGIGAGRDEPRRPHPRQRPRRPRPAGRRARRRRARSG
jgi:aminoglycoside phosphotransferase (APT) family kinase protein